MVMATRPFFSLLPSAHVCVDGGGVDLVPGGVYVGSSSRYSSVRSGGGGVGKSQA